MSPIVILAGARTPIGRLAGGLAPLTATDLGAAAIVGAMHRSGITGGQVDFAYLLRMMKFFDRVQAKCFKTLDGNLRGWSQPLHYRRIVI